MRMYFVDWYFVSKNVLKYCERSKQFLKQTCSWSLLRSNILEQFKFELEKIIGIQKSTGKS